MGVSEKRIARWQLMLIAHDVQKTIVHDPAPCERLIGTLLVCGGTHCEMKRIV